jgi:hypothetical protein
MDRRTPRSLTHALVAFAMVASLAACAGQGGDDDSPAAAASSDASSGAPKKCTVSAKLVPSCGAWWGVTPVINAREDPGTAVRDFERTTGRSVNIYHGYHVGTADMLPTAGEIALTRDSKHRMLMLNWKPDVGKSWKQIANGALDPWLTQEAAYVKSHFKQKFWLVIHHEPEDEVKTAPGSGYTAEDYRAMFQHIVTEFRSHGVRNILFTVVFMGYSGFTSKPWFKDLYPGDQYVDWIGYDPFAKSNVTDYSNLVNKVAPRQQELGFPGFYDWSAKNLPNKPLMLGEWAVLEDPDDPSRKANFFKSVAQQFKKYPRIKALSYYDADHAENMPAGGNTRVDATPQSLKAFKALGKLPEFNVKR